MQIYVKKIEIVVYLHKIYNMSIIFTDLDHSYKSGNIKYKSVSTIISEYKAPYDAYYWSLYKAYQKLLGEETFKVLKSEYKLGDHALFNYLKFYADQEKAYEIQASILDDWKNERDKSIVKGNNYHEFKEKQSFDDGYSINPFNDAKYETQKSVLITTDGSKELRTPTYGCLSDLLDGFHPELLLWNNKYQIAGQADKVYIETIKNKRYIDIDDYKTNKKISKTNIFQKMKDPISHLDDCNYNHYRLQISLYAWLLEQEGFIVRNLSFTHINKPYEFDYMYDEIDQILHHQTTLNNNKNYY